MKKLIEERLSTKHAMTDDDAAGFRKQLMQNYHCISCDRPVDITPSGYVFVCAGLRRFP